jgi:hypothetical protein
MGIFSDRCQALIEPQTGKVLTGEALAAAKQNPRAPRCGNRVKKAARFCGKCGSGSPGGWWKCPACAKWVGNESHFCWNCNTPLYPDTRAGIAGGRWQRPGGVFAERFEIGDIKLMLKDGLIIEEGTVALLLDGGALKDVLSPGRYNPESMARKINHWGNPPPRTVVLVDNGDVVLPLRVEALRTAEDIPVELYTEVAFHFVEKKASDFLANVFKGNQRLTFQEIETLLTGEIRYTIENNANTSTIEDLVKDPQRRLQIEDALAHTMKDVLPRYGLELVRVAAAEFTGKEYEELRMKSGDIEVKRRQIELDQRLRELLSSEKMDQFKTEAELNEYIAQLSQERDLSTQHRTQELALLRLVHRHEIDKKAADFAFAQAMAQTAHDIGLKKMGDEYRREAKRLEEENEAAITQMWLKVKQEKRRLELEFEQERLRIEREDEAARIAARKGADLTTLLSLIDDPAKRQSLLELNKQMQTAGKSPAEIMAYYAAENPDLARVLLEQEKAKSGDRDKEWNERKEVMNEAADRMERIMQKALETTAEAARNPGAGNQQIIK